MQKPAVARQATQEDAHAMAEIYNAGIDERLATFETRHRSSEEVATWLDGKHPVVVVEADHQVVAFASSSPYRSRECYERIAEFSVYVHPRFRTRGFGRQAMAALVASARDAGFWKLVSRIFVENQPSRSLMNSMGFREVGIYQKHGQLDGQWRDVVIVEKLLAEETQ